MDQSPVRDADGGEEAKLAAMAQACHALYDLPPGARIQLLNLSENATFLVEDDASGHKSVLRIHRPGYHSEDAILSELKWIQSLGDHPSIVTAQPIPGSDGEFIQVLEHPVVSGPRQAVMFTFLHGAEPDPTDIASFEQLGAVTAHLHEHTRGWSEAGRLRRHTWDLESMFFGHNPLWGRWQDGVGVTPARAEVLGRMADAIGERLRHYGKNHQNFGLIHADLRLANLLVHEGRIQVIDFDDCGYSWFIYDLASALSFIEDQPQIPDLIAAWVRGYRSVRDLPETDIAEIPAFIMARRLLLLAWVGSHQESPFPRQLGEGFTEATCALAEKFLSGHYLVGRP